MFSKSDEGLLGAIDYDNKQLIRAKYQRLVPLGRYFLAIHESDNDEIRLIDIDDNVIKKLDGNKIIVPHNYFFDFPIIIATNDDEMYTIDMKANKLGSEMISIISDDAFSINDFGTVENYYAPIDEMVETLLDLTDNPTSYGAFIGNSGTYCHPQDVSFIRESPVQELQGKYKAVEKVASGLNYSIYYTLNFDEPLVRDGSTLLNSTAWMNKAEIELQANWSHIIDMTTERFVSRLREKGFTKELSNESGERILFLSSDRKVLLVFSLHDPFSNFVRLWMVCGCNLDYWRQWVSEKE